MWNERYSTEDFVYGTEPNEFLVEHARELSGPVLSLAEGEGRNAVYLASIGLDVLGVDGSEVGLAKARRLAEDRGVSIRTEVADLATYDPPAESFGSVVSIWAHVPTAVRTELHRRVTRALKPGGTVLLEAYSKAQINRDTGGPKDPDRLMSCAELETEFPGCDVLLCRELEREVIEGDLHSGLASVVQFIAKKQ